MTVRPAEITDVPVSVIIAAHDEEDNLRALIPDLLRQQHQHFEIIVVEDRCNDGTYDYLLELTQQEPRVRMVRVQQKPDHINGKKYALTLGIKAAHHEWVVLTDADCRPASDQWLRQMSQHMVADKQLVLGYSPYRQAPSLLNLFIRFDTLFTAVQYLGFALGRKPYMGVGRNLAYRKNLFLDNKGFHEIREITGGDDDLFVNQHATGANTAVSLGADALMYSHPQQTLGGFIHQKIRHLSVGKYYRIRDKFRLGLFMLSALITWFAGIPLLALATLPMIYWIVAAFTLRQVLLIITFHTAAQRLGEKFEVWAVPFLDFLFAIYYISTGPIAFLTKKVRWKT